MYKHKVEEALERAKKEIAIYRKYGRTEEVEHVQRRIDSLNRIKETSPEAKRA